MPSRSERARADQHHNFSFREFAGVNTRDQRWAIEDSQFSWLEGLLPIGKGNLAVVPAPSAAIYTLPVGVTCTRLTTANINGTEYSFLFGSDGSAYQVNSATGASVQVAPPTQFTAGGTYTAQWNNSTLLIIDTTNGFYSWNGTTLVKLSVSFTFVGSISGTTLTVTSTNGVLAVGQSIVGAGTTANTVITAVISGGGGPGTYTVNNSQSVVSETMTATPSCPSGGSVIAVFSGRVWIASARTVTYSAPNSYTDFTTASTAGSFIMTDPSLRSNIFSMVVANNYMYIFGLTSVNVISDIRVSAGATLFSNTNISSSAGTDMVDAVVPYYRSIMFASDYGIFGLTGAVAKDESSDLDGTYPLIDLTKPITAGLAAVFDRLCLFFLFQYKDPTLSTTRPLIAGFMDGKWFFITPPANATLCCSGIVNDVPSLMVTDGRSLFQMFALPGTSVSHKIQTKLFDMGDPITAKKLLKFGVERVAPASISAMNITIDTEAGSNPYTSIGSNQMIWLNNSNNVISWINNAALPIIWLAAGYIFSRLDAENPGGNVLSRKYLGATLTSTTSGGTYSGIHFQFDLAEIW